MEQFLVKRAYLSNGWANDILIDINDQGIITSVEQNAKDVSNAKTLDTIIPSMPNLHSHAFQRAFAGRSEFVTAQNNSFWTWRKLMYEFVARIDAEELEDIATKLYTEMRLAGFSHVGEFHYIHHQPDGTVYEDPAHLSHAMIRAAKSAGIGITILPVLYAYSDFGAKPPEDGQKRFINDADSYLDILTKLYNGYKDDPMVRVGAAFHSLRAVSPELMQDAYADLQSLDPTMPIHIHIAEQQKEVEACMAWSRQRPVEWLLNNIDVNQHWCLVHATHMTNEETKRLAKSGAIAGLCPITEANLGDGLFNIEEYIAQGGQWGIGSDSHIAVNMLEELRLLEYGQRLKTQRRAICQNKHYRHVGEYLYTSALKGGAQALGINIGKLEKGYRADFFALEPDTELATSFYLDSLIFANTISLKAHYVAGQPTSY